MIVAKEQPTIFLLRALRVYEREPSRVQRRRCRCRGYGGARCRCRFFAFGADYPDLSTIADSAMNRAGYALSMVVQAPGAMYSGVAAWARGELLAAQADLNSAAKAAVDSGLSNAGNILTELSNRISAAWVSLSSGAGQALRSFLGFSPADAAEGLWWLALAGMGLAAIVAFSPSGAAVAGGLGRFYGSLGAGLGEGVAAYGRGAGQLLGSPEKLSFLLGVS